MKNLSTWCVLSILFFVACQHANKKEEITHNISMQEILVKPFSDSLKSDTFKVELHGIHPKDMRFVFTIHSYEGHQIYEQVFNVTELINNYKKSIHLEKEEDQVKFLKGEMKLFFDEENFLEPAVTQQEEPDQNTSDKEFYTELKQTGLNGFKYRLGNEKKIYIGWSVKAHKVKVYYKCC